MVALFVTIDILELKKHKININEYLILLKIQHEEKNESFPYDPDPRYLERLEKDDFITIKDGKYALSKRSLELFKDESLFEEFYSVFPHKVPNGTGGFRPVSTQDVNGISARNTRSIWNRLTKNKIELQRKIIDGLKKELEYRKNSNTLTFLQNIDTWLRQANWEKWEDISNEKRTNSYIKL